MALAFPLEPSPAPVVLVVEDHEDSRMMYAEFLRTRYTVFEAANAAEALEAASLRPPDVVVTDISLPGMTGLELLTELRRRGTPAFRAICLSGYATELIPGGAPQAEIVLLKPLLPDRLLDEIARLLEEQG